MIITQVFQSLARPHVEQGPDRSAVDKLTTWHTHQPASSRIFAGARLTMAAIRQKESS